MTRSRAQDEEARNEILRRLVGDAEAGALGSLEHYLAEYCGHEELVRDEYCILSAQREATHPEAVSTGGPGERVARQAKGGFFDEVLRRLSGRRVTFERYTLKGEVGSGGQGTIMRIFDEDLRRHLAMKVLRQQVSEPPKQAKESVDTRSLAQFLEEAQVTAQLDHPGIVPVHELGLDAGGRLYFTMKLVKGQTLKEVFDLVREEKEGWTRTRALGVLSKVCEAMAYAHDKGVIHRDLKPSNVMVGKYGEVYVMDWGLARVLDQDDKKDVRIRPEEPRATSLLLSDRAASRSETPESPLYTMDGDVVGTPSYMSPEQARGDLAQMGPHSDVYALGAMLYHLLASHMPYVPLGARLNNYAVWSAVQQGPPPPIHGLARDAPAELVAICEKSMAREIGERYRDMSELARDLAAFLEGRVVAAYRTGAWAETKKWVLRNKALAGSLAAAVLLLVLGLTASLVFKARADERAADLQAANTTIRQRETAAQEARAEANERAREARTSLYVASVTGAQSARRLNEPANVRRSLDSAPEELRNWEWHYLDACSDTSLLRLEGHSASLSPDGARIVTGSADGSTRVWDAESGKALAWLEGHKGDVSSVSFSSDGSRILTASVDRTARVWDAASGKELARLEGHTREVSSATFSPDGSRIATASPDRTARVWDATHGTQLALLEGHTAGVNSANFSPDGFRIVTASDDKTARVWDANDGDDLTRLEGHSERVYCATFGPDGSRVLTASADETARVWDTASGKELTRLEGHTSFVRRASFSADGTRIVTSSSDNTARVWDATSGNELARLEGHTRWVESASFSPDGSRIVTASGDSTAALWDATNGKELARFEGHTDAVNSASFGTNALRIVSASSDGTVRVWDATRDKGPVRLEGHANVVNTASFSPSGSLIVTGSGSMVNERGDSTARVWDAVSGRELVRLEGHNWGVNSASFSPDGFRILTASNDGTARVWNAVSGRELMRLEGHSWVVNSATFSPDGARILTASYDKTARVWDATTAKELARFEGHSDQVACASFSPDGSRIVTASADMTARVWDTASGKELTRLQHTSLVHSASFSLDGMHIVTASSDRTARVWDATTGNELARLEGHTSAVYCASFSPDGSRIVTGGETARVWNAMTGLELARLEGHSNGVNSAIFSRDGSRIVTGSADRTARVWDSVPHRLRHAERQALLAEHPRGERIAEEALVQWQGFAEAQSRLQADDALDPLVRRAALDILDNRARAALLRAEKLHDKQLERTWLAHLVGDSPWPDEREVESTLKAGAGLPTDARSLNSIAWRLVDPDAPPSGDEVRALLLASRAVAAAEPEAVAPYRDTLARAFYRLGRFDEALEEQRRALAEASSESKQDYEGYLRRLEADIATWRDESGELRRAEITERLQSLEREIAALEQDADVRRWLDER